MEFTPSPGSVFPVTGRGWVHGQGQLQSAWEEFVQVTSISWSLQTQRSGEGDPKRYADGTLHTFKAKSKTSLSKYSLSPPSVTGREEHSRELPERPRCWEGWALYDGQTVQRY